MEKSIGQRVSQKLIIFLWIDEKFYVSCDNELKVKHIVSFILQEGKVDNEQEITFELWTNENLKERIFIIFQQIKFLEETFYIILSDMMIQLPWESFISHCQIRWYHYSEVHFCLYCRLRWYHHLEDTQKIIRERSCTSQEKGVVHRKRKYSCIIRERSCTSQEKDLTITREST